MKLKALSVLFLSAIIFTSCKNSDKDEVTPENSSPSGLFIKGTINSANVNTADGKNGYDIVDAVAYADYNSGISASYTCSFQNTSSSNEAYFQIGYGSVIVDDGDDSDELVSFFKVGKDTLNNSDDVRFSFNYTSPDGKDYRSKSGEDFIEIFIDSIADGGSSSGNKKQVLLFGRIPSATLHEFSWETFSYTGNTIDVTDTEFAIRFRSAISQ